MNQNNAAYDIFDENESYTSEFLGRKETYNVPHLLGDCIQNVGGTMRPGIMALKRGAGPQEERIYNEMLAQGASWDAIDKKLGKDKDDKSKLKPLNVDYFTVRESDCINPENAETVKKLYADNDGYIRSLPIWFPFNNWWDIIYHQLAVYSKGRGIRYRSAFIERREENRMVGIDRVCQFPKASSEPKKEGNVVRLFGGRDWAVRACQPETCTEYQKRECKLTGQIYFFVPGVKGSFLWTLPTHSWYSLSRIKSTIEMVRGLTGGRVARLFNDDGTAIFRLRKRKDKITMLDDNGESVLVEQYLIELDTDCDPLELAQKYETSKVLERGAKAIAMLTPSCTSETGSNGSAIEAEATTESKQVGLSEGMIMETQQTADDSTLSEPVESREKQGSSGAPEKEALVSEKLERKGGQGTVDAAQVGRHGSPDDFLKPEQIAAIRKLVKARRPNTPEERIEAVLETITTGAKAKEMITRLNKGDTSAFEPRAIDTREVF